MVVAAYRENRVGRWQVLFAFYFAARTLFWPVAAGHRRTRASSPF